MARNFIPGLRKVDWSDPQRQNEFVNSVVSALNALGERLSYDAVCALSGSAFRTSFSMPDHQAWNHGNYHVVNAPILIEHTFHMLGYEVARHPCGDFATDKQLILDSIDRGVPAITLEGVVNCADACVISGYDNDGDVLLGHSPFADVPDDHAEAPDETGYFRKSHWHEGPFAEGGLGEILIIGGKREAPPKEQIFRETLALIRRLIREDSLVPGQYNGLAAHRAFVSALRTYEWEDNFEPYLNTMCNFKQYLDRQYAVPFFRANGQEELAACYEQIASIAARMAHLIPQDFSASDLFSDRNNLIPYCEWIEEVSAMEERALARIDDLLR